MSSPTADVSVRVAWGDDAAGIAGVQVRAWRSAYADLLPTDVLEAFTPEAVTTAWAESLAKPKDARNRVLVALERNRITGFAVTSPAADPDCDPIADGEVAEFAVDPDELGKGHGSRLIQACADTLRADRFSRAVSWVNASDDAHRAFFESAGWAPDTAHRELDLRGDGSVTVKQVRLHTAL
ncbi:GNAT family N-acetyltransferase [Nocardioides jensenii]|uniref:GNAT family N-acetyltransferase n=1 Tax=Nocardioides jensenii TaxID=1843 RepID=UPI0008363320|nr:GNAT family N-acetyltransferase [Nocardioides jensenii]